MLKLTRPSYTEPFVLDASPPEQNIVSVPFPRNPLQFCGVVSRQRIRDLCSPTRISKKQDPKSRFCTKFALLNSCLWLTSPWALSLHSYQRKCSPWTWLVEGTNTFIKWNNEYVIRIWIATTSSACSILTVIVYRTSELRSPCTTSMSFCEWRRRWF